MRAAPTYLLMVAALLTLIAAPVALAAAVHPPTNSSIAMVEPCSSARAHMTAGCGGDCMCCDQGMTGCRANAACQAVVAVELSRGVVIRHDAAGPTQISRPYPALPGRSIEPEIHPPSALDQQALTRPKQPLHAPLIQGFEQ